MPEVHSRPKKNYREFHSLSAYIKRKRKGKRETEVKKEPSKLTENPLGKRKIKGRFSGALKKRQPYEPPPKVYSESTTEHIKSPKPARAEIYSRPTNAHIQNDKEVYSRPTNPELTRRETR